MRSCPDLNRSPFLRKDTRKILSVAVLLVILGSVLAWTVLSPLPLSPQSQGQLSSSLFSFAKTASILNISDGEGSYSFLFGMDYNGTLTPGIPAIVEVFVSLLSENKSSGFLKGVSLDFVSSGVLVDGSEDTGVKSMVTNSGGIITDRLSGVDINDTGGTHELTARLIISTVDVNYIGFLSGTEQVTSLNGTITIN
jgi:hypothetical protein